MTERNKETEEKFVLRRCFWFVLRGCFWSMCFSGLCRQPGWPFPAALLPPRPLLLNNSRKNDSESISGQVLLDRLWALSWCPRLPDLGKVSFNTSH